MFFFISLFRILNVANLNKKDNQKYICYAIISDLFYKCVCGAKIYDFLFLSYIFYHM